MTSLEQELINYADSHDLPIVNPYAEGLADCPRGTQRINNYFTSCYGVLWFCRDACFYPDRRYYEGIGSWKLCGLCSPIEF